MYKLKDNRIWDKHGIINRKQLYQILAKTEKILKFNLIQIIQRRINNLDLLKRFKSIRYNEGHSFLWRAATASYHEYIQNWFRVGAHRAKEMCGIIQISMAIKI